MERLVLDTNYKFYKQKRLFKGKVRDVYLLEDDIIIMISTDRISAFDIVFPFGIPYKGKVLNSVSDLFFDKIEGLIPNWRIYGSYDNVMIGRYYEPIKIEFIVRKYISGSLWRMYKSKKENVWKLSFPENLKENQELDKPIITPTIKSDQGHDIDISEDEIIRKGILSKKDYFIIKDYCFELFRIGEQYAKERGLILLDTKYEFGMDKKGDVHLIDELHTPDSSRFCKEGDLDNSLSKEFFRKWLMKNGFSGRKGDKMPKIEDSLINKISDLYIDVYEKLSGLTIDKSNSQELDISKINDYIKSIKL